MVAAAGMVEVDLRLIPSVTLCILKITITLDYDCLVGWGDANLPRYSLPIPNIGADGLSIHKRHIPPEILEKRDKWTIHYY